MCSSVVGVVALPLWPPVAQRIELKNSVNNRMITAGGLVMMSYKAILLRCEMRKWCDRFHSKRVRSE